MAESSAKVCRWCGAEGVNSYCSNCGQPYTTKRITLPGLLHDAFHLFTHFDKGFAYTVKKLVAAPGHMQRSFIEGERTRFQKPFSMFFVCATIAAVCGYWVFSLLIKYFHVGSMSEANFSHAYMVMLQVALVPFYAFISYVLFYNTKYNYAEIGVLNLYTIAFIFLVATVTVLLKFIWPFMDTAYVEFPIFVVYNTITLLNFFNNRPRWEVIVKSILIATVIFFVIQKMEDIIIDVISRSGVH